VGGTLERRVLHDPGDVAHEAAEFFVWLAEQAARNGEIFRVALAGGSTPRLLYHTLSSAAFRDQVKWSSMEYFFGDERAVPPTHPDSNFRMAEETLFTPLAISPDRVFRMLGEAQDLDEAAHRYETVIRERFSTPAPAWPQFHLILLGMGDDGHTASLFPGAPALQENRRAVVATRAPQGVPNRLTLTLPLINHAATVIFVVTGAAKAPAVHAVLEQPETSGAQYPAKLVRPSHGRVIWLLDQAAAAELLPEQQHLTYEEE
jgi:6-phosphogluconolactonase